MQTLRLLPWLLLLFCSSLLADGPVWRVENGSRVLYLGGTLHLLRQRDYPLPDSFDRAFEQAGRLVFETDIAATRDSAFLTAMDQALRLPSGERLSQRISAETRVLLQAKLAQFGQTLDSFDGYRTAMLSISLTMMELQRLGVDAPGVDELFFRRAQAAGKAIGWLETPQQQIDFLARMGDGEEDGLLRQTLAELGTLEREFPRMIEAWRKGDLEGLEHLFVQPMRAFSPRLYRELLVQRNRRWLPQILELLKTPERELVLVGSAHLAGPDGLIRSLRERGYRVSPLDSTAGAPAD